MTVQAKKPAMSEAEAVRVPSIPPSINPKMIERHYTKDPISRERVADEGLDAILDTMAFAHGAVHRMADAHEKIMKNQMETIPRRQQQATKAADHAFQQVAGRVDQTNARIAKVIAEIEKKTFAPALPSDALSAFAAVTICGNFAKLSPEDRQKQIEVALASDDDLTIAAILNAPQSLSGVVKAERDMVRLSWRSRRFKPELDRLERLKKAKRDLDQAAELFFVFWRRLSPDITVAEASEKAAREAMKPISG